MSMIRSMAVAAFAAMLLAVSPARAEDAVKVAVVDIQKIVGQSTATKDIQKQIEKKKNEFQSQINKQEEALMKEDQELSKQKASLSADKFEEKRKEFKNKVAQTQRDVQKKRTQLESAYADALAQVQKSVLDIIKGMADDKGFTLALPSSQVLYYHGGMDISDEVLEKLNKDLPKVDVTVKDIKSDKK